MGKVDRLCIRELTFCCPAGNVLANTWPCTRHGPCITPSPYTCSYMVIVGSILNKDAPPSPLFLSRYVIYLKLRPLNVRSRIRIRVREKGSFRIWMNVRVRNSNPQPKPYTLWEVLYSAEINLGNFKIISIINACMHVFII